eukprot:TRINITY_DN15157_c0_g1_i1.p2 TRINITY_DN15157_c0_g1~~TRINITY_DN15157_c0_g1_i1.p2  ORF type:complete len:215 (-),score=68.13 TRINITY_DN15157_c0_g1_i1:135-779(-)
MAAEALFMHAVQHGRIEEASMLLKRGRAHADLVMAPTNTSALHAATRAADTRMVEMLLQAKADVNAQEAMICGGKTPLHLAAESELVGIATSLLNADANLLTKDSRGLTPLHAAAQEGRCDVTKILLAKGADPFMRDYSGHNAAWWAKEFKHAEVSSLYREMNVDPINITAKQVLVHAGVAGKLLRKAKKKKKEGKDGDASVRATSGSARPGRR